MRIKNNRCFSPLHTTDDSASSFIQQRVRVVAQNVNAQRRRIGHALYLLRLFSPKRWSTDGSSFPVVFVTLKDFRMESYFRRVYFVFNLRESTL